MKAIINGEEKDIRSGITILEYFNELSLNIQTAACEINGTIIKREQFADVEIKEHDTIEIVNFVGGG